MASNNRAKIIVDPAGKAGLYQPAPIPGYTALGTVTQGFETGALYRNDRTGTYVMANAGAIRSLDQRKVRSALGIGPGRPEKMLDGKPRNVYMSDRDAEYLREIGNGNLSEGIRIAVSAHRDQ